MKQYIKPRKSLTFFGLGFVEMILSPWLGFLSGVFLTNHLVITDNLTKKNQKTEHIPTETNNTQKGALINNNTIKNYTNRKTEPGLVAFYDIRPGNGAGLFLQPGVHMGNISSSFFHHKLSIRKLDRPPEDAVLKV